VYTDLVFDDEIVGDPPSPPLLRGGQELKIPLIKGDLGELSRSASHPRLLRTP
jgi:hypothetical protein